MNYQPERPEPQQRDARAQVNLICELRQGTRPWRHEQLEDISRSGFRIVGLTRFNDELPIRIRIPGLAVLTATVRWREGRETGCSFDQPLHVAVFEHIVRHARSD